MRGFADENWGRTATMLRLVSWVAVGLVVAGMAAAQDRAVAGAESGDRFWVQERPMSALVSPDLMAQDRRFAGALGYGVNLVPPAGRDGAGLDLTGAGSAGNLSIRNWHFGVDVLQPGGVGRTGSVAQFAMNYGGHVSDSLALSVGPTLSVGGDGASSLLGSQSGGFLRRLQSDAGVRDYGLRGSAVYSLSDNWALTGVLGYRRTVGELGAAQSDDQFFSVLGLGYRF
jgi:hypothetical protein